MKLKHPLQTVFFLIPVFVFRIIIVGASFADSLCLLGLLSYCIAFRHYSKKHAIEEVKSTVADIHNKIDGLKTQVGAVRVANGFRRQE